MALDKVFIGIDPGVNTGFAMSVNGEMVSVDTHSAVGAEERILRMVVSGDFEITVYIEDARKRTWYGAAGRERLKGVGSVERDCSRWQEFCEHYQINYELIAPKNNRTKLTAKQFNDLTGCTMRTSEHGRDAAMLIFGRK